SIRYFLMMVWSLFIISLMGLFWYSKSPIISRVELPTTEIIEPYLDNVRANKLAAALAVGAEVAALAGLVPASAVGAIIGGIFAIGSGLVWYNNAAGRGIIIGCTGQFPHAKAHWITSQ
ncbi:hypothetical protein ACVRW4_02390, partial [Streptococcus phocae subsp. phocae]